MPNLLSRERQKIKLSKEKPYRRSPFIFILLAAKPIIHDLHQEPMTRLLAAEQAGQPIRVSNSDYDRGNVTARCIPVTNALTLRFCSYQQKHWSVAKQRLFLVGTCI
jgi:hypothetical protein